MAAFSPTPKNGKEFLGNADLVAARLRSDKNLTQAMLANEYSVSRQTIGRYVKAAKWNLSIREIIHKHSAKLSYTLLYRFCDRAWSDVGSKSLKRRPRQSLQNALIKFAEEKKAPKPQMSKQEKEMERLREHIIDLTIENRRLRDELLAASQEDLVADLQAKIKGLMKHIRELETKKPQKPKKIAPISANYLRLLDELQSKFGARLTLDLSQKQLIIEYMNDDVLFGILERT